MTPDLQFYPPDMGDPDDDEDDEEQDDQDGDEEDEEDDEEEEEEEGWRVRPSPPTHLTSRPELPKLGRISSSA
ncbi:MAG TPA: hypothetical protein VF332_13340 [Vicinamibacterales bacterium]